MDAGAESFATRSTQVPPFLASIGLGDQIVAPHQAGAWLFSADASGRRRAAPLPKTGLLGIPGHPLAADVRRVIGLPAALRAATDRIRKPDPSFNAVSLGQLVRTRLGSATLDRLVRPVVGGVYSADPDTLAVDAVAPSLRAELHRTGSLTRAVAALTAQAEPGSAVRGVIGGNYEIVSALVRELSALGVELRTDHEAVRLSPAEGGTGWVIDDTITAATVIVATPPRAAATLLAGVHSELVPRTAQPTATRIDTVVVRSHALDSAPRGTGILLGETHGLVAAKALTHVSAKWAWVAERLTPGVHVIRVSYREETIPERSGLVTSAGDPSVALHDASILMGVPLTPADLIDYDTVTWTQYPVTPASVRSVRTRLPHYPGLGVTGSWATGTGLASVIPGSLDEAERVCKSFDTPEGMES
ncbi:protoporphyrinogen oxidase [Klugiella xanthotipulae]